MLQVGSYSLPMKKHIFAPSCQEHGGWKSPTELEKMFRAPTPTFCFMVAEAFLE